MARRVACLGRPCSTGIPGVLVPRVGVATVGFAQGRDGKCDLRLYPLLEVQAGGREVIYGGLGRAKGGLLEETGGLGGIAEAGMTVGG